MRRLAVLFVALALPLTTFAAPAGATNFTPCYYGYEDGASAGAQNTINPYTGFNVVKHDPGVDKCDGITWAGSLYVVRRSGSNIFAVVPHNAETLRAGAGNAGSLRWAAANTDASKPVVGIWPIGQPATMTPAAALDLADDFDAACGTTC